MTNNLEFWAKYKITSSDLDLLYNHLLEIETPLNKQQLSAFIIDRVNSLEKVKLEKERLSGGDVYLPKNTYSAKQNLVFPQRNWQKGTVKSIRKGQNPTYPELFVLEVVFSPNETVLFASNLQDHILNTPIEQNIESPNDYETIEKIKSIVADKLESYLSSNEDLVCIAGSYFPRSLLVDVGVGHLNLCEAVLEMSNGGPLTTTELINQIELPTDVNHNLTEFSLNLALQEDGRFDEVGPAGETLWFLQRLEPADVQSIPITLKYIGQHVELSQDLIQFRSLGSELCDELETDCNDDPVDEVVISLTYPHWRAGTLPLTSKLKSLFPTAYETPRVKFDFITGNNTTISGWVVRPSKYIFGLREWYLDQGFIPGSLIHISRSKIPGKVIVRAEKQRNMKEWIRTVLVGADGGVVFALLKQVVTCTFDERMALVISDGKAVDQVWEQNMKNRAPLEKVIQSTMRELSKLNPQGHIHAQEIYASVNVLRRCPPSVIVNALFSQPWSSHLGDLYFKYIPD